MRLLYLLSRFSNKGFVPENSSGRDATLDFGSTANRSCDAKFYIRLSDHSYLASEIDRLGGCNKFQHGQNAKLLRERNRKKKHTESSSDSVGFERQTEAQILECYLNCLNSEALKNGLPYERLCTRPRRCLLLSHSSNDWPQHTRFSSSDNYLRAFFKSISPAPRSKRKKNSIIDLECANFSLSLEYLLLQVAAFFDLLRS